MYYNTNHLTADALKAAIAQCGRQELRVYAIFNTAATMTPSECWRAYGDDNVPLTSIRRAITDLTVAGLLHKTRIMRMGEYGKLEHAWTRQHDLVDNSPSPANTTPPATVAQPTSTPGEGELFAMPARGHHDL